MCSKHSPEEYKALMDSMDRNGDGIITWDEFVAAAINKVTLLNERNVKAAFTCLDEDKNGRITTDELKRKFEGSQED